MKADEKSKTYTIDASFILAFLLPDETNAQTDEIFERFQNREIDLIAPSLLVFEVTNSLVLGIRRKRISARKATYLAKAFLSLQTEIQHVDSLAAMKYAIQNNLSVYDATYVVLARSQKAPLLSFDKKLKKIAGSA